MNRPKNSSVAAIAGMAVASALVVTAIAANAGAVASDPQVFQAFSHENDVAMDKMMAAMTIKPSGDVDKDFAAMMIPHHAGAIDMALSELRHGRNEQLRRIAQEIIVEQQQEIDAMHLALGQAVASAGPAPTQVGTVPEPESVGASASMPTHHHHSN